MARFHSFLPLVFCILPALACAKVYGAEPPESALRKEALPTIEIINTDFLNNEERKFINRHPVIRVANETDWPPFDFVDKKKQPAGYSVDYISLVAEKAGLRIEWVSGNSWETLIQYGKERKVDVFPAIIETHERAHFLDFTNIYLENVFSYFVREDAPIEIIESIEQLLPYRLALVKGYANYQSMEKYYPQIEVLAVDSVLEGLKAVLTGDADIFIGDAAVCNYVIKDNLLSNLRRAGSVNIPELQQTSQIRIGSRNDRPLLSSLLKKGMAQISDDELRTLHKRWLATPPLPLLTGERLILMAALIIIIAVILAILWIFSLRRQRTRLIQEIGSQNQILNESEKRLSLALQRGEMVAWDTDYQTGETLVSSGLWAMMAMAEETNANAWHFLQQSIHAEDRMSFKQGESDYLSGRAEKLQMEYRIIRQDGATRWLVHRGATVASDWQGHPLRAVGVIQDITEGKNLERMKDEFISSVSHELRTPLTSIKGALGLLIGGVGGDLPEKARQMLDIAYENSGRLAVLVDDLLDIEKLLAGEMILQKDTLIAGDLVNKAVTANQAYADKYGVHFLVEDNECNTCAFIADESRLLQVLSNFISNAVKYSPEGGCITISVKSSGKTVSIAVTDTGEGIEEAFREHVFQRFAQADSSNTRSKGGTGLGLAISKEIIECHGGKIGFDSPPGKGATFYFTLNLN